jgi:hypothetical protein
MGRSGTFQREKGKKRDAATTAMKIDDSEFSLRIWDEENICSGRFLHNVVCTTCTPRDGREANVAQAFALLL